MTGTGVSAASAADTEALVALWEACGLTRPWNDPRGDIALALDTPTSDILVLRDGEDLLASAMVGFDGHRGWVYYLAVAPAAQGRGLGTRMMRACED
jgi:ribosomal protein S18 acetylase RimI-like enzyme